MHFIGDHHRQMGGGQFQRHGARGGNRHVGGGKGGAFQRRIGDQLRLHHPIAGQVADQPGQMRHGRQRDADMAVNPGDPCYGFTDHRGQPCHLTLARAGQRQDQRARAVHQVTLLWRGQRLGHDGMTNKIAGHAHGGHIGRLKGQKRQNMVDHPGHFGGALRPPRPDRGGDIVDHALSGTRGFHQRRHAQAEIRAVDGDHG